MMRLLPLVGVILVNSVIAQRDDSYHHIMDNSVSWNNNPFGRTQYLALASRVVRPGQVYRVPVSILSSSEPVLVRASLHRDNIQIGLDSELMAEGQSHTLMLQIPNSLKTKGNFVLKFDGSINGGTVFQNETQLQFSERFLTILIQTSQLVYNMELPILFRVVLLTTELKAYSDPVNVFLVNAEGFIMKRWVSVYPNLGFISKSFVLPYDYPQGWWKVRVEASGQIEEKKFLVERWFTHRYDVNVGTPAFILATEETLEGFVLANYTHVAGVHGNTTIRASVRPRDTRDPQWKNYHYLEQVIDKFKGYYEFSFQMSEIERLANPVPLHRCEILVEAEVGERFFDIKVKGFSSTRVINAKVTLQFIGPNPQIFKPGMPFRTQISVSYDDLVPLDEDKLAKAKIRIEPAFYSAGGSSRKYDWIEPLLDEKGIAEFELDTPENVERIALKARYQDAEDTVYTELTLISFVSSKNRFLHITSSTKVAKAGEYAIFHVWGNYYMETFQYLIASKGIILHSDEVKVQGQVKSVSTFAVAISPEMAPNLRVLVYHVTPDGEFITDSIALPISAINRGNKFSLKINRNQDRVGNIIEFNPRYDTDSRVGLSSCDSDMISNQHRNDLTPSSVLEEMYKFEREPKRLHRVVWRDRDGAPDVIQYYHTPNLGQTANETLKLADLIIFTNINVTSIPNVCNASLGYSSCRNGQCYLSVKRCDKFKDCPDGTDEGDCEEELIPDLFDFYVFRKNRHNPFFDAPGGNFGWKDILLGHQPLEFTRGEVPQGPSVYMINAIAMNRKHGFAILDTPVLHDSTKNFIMTYDCPEIALLGEQIGIRIAIMNFQHIEIKVEVILESSEDYKFIQIDSMNIVPSYDPKTYFGELQHLVYILPVNEILIYFPIVATRTGDIEVSILGRGQAALEVAKIPITILPDSVPVSLHTSLLLDMRTESYNLKFLDINVTEDPIIPYEDGYRMYIFGSPRAEVSVIGDVVGVPLPEDEYISGKDLGYSEAVKSGEHIFFDFAYNIYTLVYLRLTNQLKSKVARRILEHLNTAYVYSMMYFKNGAFTMFGNEPSVWLTAYVSRVLWVAQYPDWENYLYIDPKYIPMSIEFILKHQKSDGSFFEPTPYSWNSKLDMEGNWRERYNEPSNVSLTAQVLITLVEIESLPGDLKARTSSAKAKAVRYLDHRIQELDDPYQVALATYALSLAGSVEAARGFYTLDAIKREADGMIYWSPDPIPATRFVYFNQRPFIQARRPRPCDAMAVEATSYALLVYIRYGGIIQDQIVKWLNSMRMHDSGFISTQDTIVAIQALTEYSFRTHIRDISFMKVVLESSANAGEKQRLSIDRNTLATRRTVEIGPNIWGHVEVLSQGSGMAILQMNVNYNVDRDFLLVEPPEQSFDLTVDAYYGGRNNSIMNIEACTRWTLMHESRTSGLTVIEIDLPTGYYSHRPILNEYVARGTVRGLKRARVFYKSAVFMFDYVTPMWTCVNFTVERWFAVANLTRYLKAKVYDYYMPERYKEIVYEDYPLYVLSICEVCGSYQCPYCPFFSTGSFLKASIHVVIAFVCILLFIMKPRS